MEKQTINLLLVDDDEDDFLLTSEYLTEIKSKNFKINYASNFEKGIEEISKNCHDIMIFDYLLGAKTGLDLFVKSVEMGCESPVILLTGKGDFKTDMEAMRLGISDYLVKSELDSEKLDRSIRYAMERAMNIRSLKESEEKYRTIFERSRDMIYITNETGDFLEFNESATRIFGYSREEFQKLNASELYKNPSDRNAFLETIQKTGIVTNYEVTLKHKSGEPRFCLISGTIQHGPDKTIYYQGIIHDVTRRRKAERDLVIAEKLAVTGRVVYTLAHEIRNPLTNVNLSVEQLESEIQNEEQIVYLDIIKRNIKRIDHLLTELLQSAKPAEIKRVKHSINTILDETIELAMDRMVLKNIKLIKSYSEGICDVDVDESKIKIALLNLIINAVEAMPESGGVLKIKTSSKDGRCLIAIEDNGAGIKRENLGRLFEPYFTGKPNGLGLGLATTHNILQSHNATIDVESEEGKGTKFLISIEML
jgi:PAS domain S-box-containing protein